jgi:hypothetical protein
MTQQQQDELKDLCQLAMSEQDEIRLLQIFLALNEVVERETPHASLGMSLQRAYGSAQSYPEA